MKICHLITRMIIGGAQENTLLTCAGLEERGHDVTLIAGAETGPEGSLWPEVERLGIKHIVVDSMVRAVKPLQDWACLRRLETIFREQAFDVVHTHSSKAGIIGRAAARRAGMPHVIHTIHGMSFNRTQSWPVRWLYRSLEQLAGDWTDAFVTVADAMTEQAVEAGLGPREKFTTIYSGMRTDLFGPNAETRARVRAEWGVDDEAVIVGTIARLFRGKGYEQIIEAMPEMCRQDPRLQFVWVGDGRDRERYLAQVTKLGLRDRVHLTGLVLPEVIPQLLTGFDILLHASQWEGLPRALPQALLTEVPVVSFDNDGAPEVVESGVTGELVGIGNVSGLAAAVGRMAKATEERKQQGSRGRECCLRMFAHQQMVSHIEALYGSIRSIAPNTPTKA